MAIAFGSMTDQYGQQVKLVSANDMGSCTGSVEMEGGLADHRDMIKEAVEAAGLSVLQLGGHHQLPDSLATGLCSIELFALISRFVYQ